MAKPLTTSAKNRNSWSVSALEPKSQYQIPTPSRPSAATDSPMTDPPKKATRSALLCPDSLAAAVVRTLARVAAFMPKKPAATELNAPVTYAKAV